MFPIGLIGCGSFGRFCLEQFRQLPSVEPVAVADLDEGLAKKTGEMYGLPAMSSEELLRRQDIRLVHIATPPNSHRDLVMSALEHGKHVLCEKPLATNMHDAETMVEKAKAANLILAVNLIMRYNPLCEKVREILERRLLGEPIHAFFENYAKDEPLGPDHWFWNREVSGGIFVEHGVHFFDLFEWWLGDGEVLAAASGARPGSAVEEQVEALCRFGGQVLTSFYHGFHQATVMDRQEFRIVCERGDIRLFEWVPTSMEIRCLADEETLAALREFAPGSESCVDGPGAVVARWKPFDASRQCVLRGDAGMEKQALYAHIVKSLLLDQIASIESPAHRRRVTEENGIRSLKMAIEAGKLAESS